MFVGVVAIVVGVIVRVQVFHREGVGVDVVSVLVTMGVVVSPAG